MIKGNLKVKIAKTAGFCFGVRRAIEIAEKTAKEKSKVYTLGPLIHNPQEVNRLAREGIKPVNSPWRMKDCTLILRTHGITESFEQKLRSKKLDLVDAVCPFVGRAQDLVRKLTGDNYKVVIIGDKTHPEVIALVSYGKGRCKVIEDKYDLKGLNLGDKVGVVSQTTQNLKKFKEIVKFLKKRYKNAVVYNTICRATIDRQSEASNIARNVDLMIVVGGKNSGNTKRLYEICRKYTKTRHIEKAGELKQLWFRNIKSIGLTAGASTPDWIIKEVENKIRKIKATLEKSKKA
ncbi:MAG: 4-hydroxy-3-methylbut-2-enyl diphosphate reductase [Endomicrobiales bacterium]|nr:4-hydroxy-3-methylbut-2-enyl diphosphate reductase [Endomicrobiales bacterium]